jgi:hypothetical protein
MLKTYTFAIGLSRAEFDETIKRRAKSEWFNFRLHDNKLILQKDWLRIGKLPMIAYSCYYATLTDVKGNTSVVGAFRVSRLLYVIYAIITLLTIAAFLLISSKQRGWHNAIRSLPAVAIMGTIFMIGVGLLSKVNGRVTKRYDEEVVALLRSFEQIYPVR